MTTKIEPGMILPNGAEVLQAKPVEQRSSKGYKAWIVLAQWRRGGIARYENIIWRCFCYTDGRVVTVYGHYYGSYQAALKSFEQRT